MSQLRNSDFARKYISNAEEQKDPSVWCPDCWLMRPYCVCAQLATLGPPFSLGCNRMLVYMHYKEHRRSSNSAVLLQTLMPEHTKTILFGTEDGDREFAREIEDEALRNCVLFPSEKSMPITEWMSQRPGKPIRLIALDGTWKQCKKMSKSLPKSLPLVRLDPDMPSRFRSRKQTAFDRLSTLEAVALAWKLIGADVMDKLMAAFDAKDKAGMAQKHRLLE